MLMMMKRREGGVVGYVSDVNLCLVLSPFSCSLLQLLGVAADDLSLPHPLRKRARYFVRGPGTGSAHGHQLLHCLPGHRRSLGRCRRDALRSVYPGKCEIPSPYVVVVTAPVLVRPRDVFTSRFVYWFSGYGGGEGPVVR